MKKKLRAWVALLLAGALALSGCGGGGGDNGSGSGDGGEGSGKTTLTVAIPTDPGNLKMDNKTNYTAPFMYNVMESLYAINEDGTYRHPLIEEATLDEDGQGVTFKLKEGVKFHNGDEMKASDVMFSTTIAMTGGFSANMDYLDMDQSQVLGDYEIYYKFTKVYGPWEQAFTCVSVISQAAYESTDEAEFWLSPVATGPFSISEWTSGDHITLTRFDDYWDGPAKLETILFRVINETSVAFMELQTGGVDLCYSVSNDDVNNLLENPDENLTVFSKQGNVGHYLGINNSKELLSDIRVRQALAYAIDREALIEGSFDGNATLNDGILGPGDFGYSDTYAGDNYPYQYNPDKARELLKEAGAENITLSIVVDDTAVRRSMAEQLYNMFADVGITLNIQQYDFATATDTLNNTTDWDLFLRSANVNTGEMLVILKNAAVYGLNRMDVLPVEGYQEWADLLNQIEGETDTEARAALYQELMDRFITDWFFWVPTVIPDTYMIHASNLTGFEYTDAIYWHDAYFE